MLKPRVGLMEDISSPLIRLTIVVLPALSRPLFATAVHRLRLPFSQPCSDLTLSIRQCSSVAVHAGARRCLPAQVEALKSSGLHHQYAKFLLALLDLFDNGQQPHPGCFATSSGSCLPAPLAVSDPPLTVRGWKGGCVRAIVCSRPLTSSDLRRSWQFSC